MWYHFSANITLKGDTHVLQFYGADSQSTGENHPDEKGNLTYIQFETGRTYYPEKKYTIPVRVSIGKLDPDHPEMMYPNEKFS